MLADSTMEKETPTFAGVRVYILGGTDVTYRWDGYVHGLSAFCRCLSTYLYPSANLDGETTRRYRLNLDRGSGTLDAQHIVRKREPQRETVKSRSQQDGSEGHICVIV